LRWIEKGEDAILLVDSEEEIRSYYQKGAPDTWNPWGFLSKRKGDWWIKPSGALANDCHLMVQCMESWIIADANALAVFYCNNFNVNGLPKNNHIELIDKLIVYKSLANATRGFLKGSYSKSEHSFELLALTDPFAVFSSSPWAKRFINELLKRAALPLI
jgi:hypothetical protein